MSKPAWEIAGDGWTAADGEFGAEAVGACQVLIKMTKSHVLF